MVQRNIVKAGVLFIVATPIGNLKDIAYRAVEVLRDVDLIAAEDTRKSRILLDRYGIIGKKLVSYFGPKEAERAKTILRYLESGKSAALVTDAGTPGISDPALKVVRMALASSIEIVPIPGPSALITALCASGLPAAMYSTAVAASLLLGSNRRTIESATASSGITDSAVT